MQRNPTSEDSLWPGGVIPCVLSVTFTRSQRQGILQAMDQIQAQTCVRFVPAQPQHDRVVSIIVGQGCYSYVGRAPPPSPRHQPLSLGVGCHRGATVLHELLHTVGLYHEHNRHDRDQHVVVHLHNVSPEYRNEFTKNKHPRIQGWQFPYDYRSVMHYSSAHFARQPSLVTLEARNPGLVLGNDRSMTKMDVKKVNFLYQCQSDDHDWRNRFVGDRLPRPDNINRKVTLFLSMHDSIGISTGPCLYTLGPQHSTLGLGLLMLQLQWRLLL